MAPVNHTTTLTDLPEDVLIKLMIEMNLESLQTFIHSSTELKALYQKHRETIYKEKLAREFSDSYEDMYLLFRSMKFAHPDLPELLTFNKQVPNEDFSNIVEFSRKMLKYISIMKSKTMDKFITNPCKFQLHLIVHLLTYITKCLQCSSYLNTNKMLVMLTKKIEDLNQQVLDQETLYSQAEKEMWYKTYREMKLVLATAVEQKP